MTPKKPSPAELIETLQLSGEEDLDAQIKKWILWDKNEATVNQVIAAASEQDWEALRQRLCNRITFGTAGLRSVMRAGFDSMNDLVVIQTAQGLCQYLIECNPNIQKREGHGIVIGYDGRYNSKRFAQLSAVVFLNNNFRVHLFQRTVATPFVAFTVLHKKCLAGIMVTASHNRKEDNGYKVYWSNGSQIITPIDENIEKSILNCLEPKPASWDLSILDTHNLLEDPYTDVSLAYYDALKKMLPPVYMQSNECSQLRFIYTAMHGVGYPYVREAFYQARLKPVIPVVAQRDPNPEFPTVKFPNPEEGKSALDLSIKLAEQEHCTVILANDPDADRLAVVELDPKGRWKVFTGNELGALLGWWALENYKTRTTKPDVGNCVMIASTVSSKILATMAKAEGFTFVETLIGFKWIGNKASEIQAMGKNVLFAFEEAIGFMVSTNVLDKDGVSAACHIATMACYLRNNRNMTLIEKLREIYDTYGYHATICSYIICDDQELIKRIFERLRTFDEGMPDTYPRCILEGEFEVKSVRDLTTGVDTSFPDRLPRLPVSASCQMITFTFTNGLVVTLRTSGTEPKMKYYAEICGLPEQKDWDELIDTLNYMVEAVVEEFYEPNKNGLKRKRMS